MSQQRQPSESQGSGTSGIGSVVGEPAVVEEAGEPVAPRRWGRLRKLRAAVGGLPRPPARLVAGVAMTAVAMYSRVRR